MADVTIYHNPKCSKSRETLKLLRDRGIEPEVIDYQQTPLNPGELDALCERLGKEPTEVIRTKEALFRELGLSVMDERSRWEWLELLHDYPKLLERPIVVRGERAAIGRPPESVLEILD